MEEESIPLRSLEEERVSKDLSRFNVDGMLSLPQETKAILINALLNSGASSSSAPTATYKSTPYCMFIDFSDEDLLFRYKLHNRSLYVSGYVREWRVDWILIDNGSTVNIMSKLTMRQLGILMDKLSNMKLIIQGFNQGNQRVIDTRKESTSRASVWHRIKHTVVENYHGKEFPCKESEIETLEEDAEDVLQSLEDGGQSTVDELKEVNLGIIEEPRPSFISISLSNEEEDKYTSLLIEYRDIFAWSYKKVSRLDPKVTVHHLTIKPGFGRLIEDEPSQMFIRCDFRKVSWLHLRRGGSGADIVLISLEKHMLPYIFGLAELCSNNVAEYQALIIGLQMALKIEVSFIEIYGDSKLIINQLSLQYDVKHEALKRYFTYARQLMERFDSVMLKHVFRIENKRADTLANFATALTPEDITLNIPLCQQWIMPPILSECQ
ncbi:uncharacterized protein E6C27_scaffold285G003870 [Cucumis melo var. makuwa]|nr:uncharacterized protein E6C27_scaffold285G003870 [Cucumis melo var. makuwa]